MAPRQGKSSRGRSRTKGRSQAKPLLVPAEELEKTANVQQALTQADSFEVVRTAITVVVSFIMLVSDVSDC